MAKLPFSFLHLSDGADGDAGGAAAIGSTGVGVLPAFAVDGPNGTVVHTQSTACTQLLPKRLARGQRAVGDDRFPFSVPTFPSLC